MCRNVSVYPVKSAKSACPDKVSVGGSICSVSAYPNKVSLS